MALLRRSLPAEARAGLDLRRGERVIAWASLRSPTGYAVATGQALHVDGIGRIPWDRIDRAAWEEPVLQVTVRPGPGAQPQTLFLDTDDPGQLPVVVRERVEATFVVRHHVRLDGDRGARIVARRGSDDTTLRWSVVFDAGLDPADPRLRATVDEALAVLRGHVG